jgi:hypothetical protein
MIGKKKREPELSGRMALLGGGGVNYILLLVNSHAINIIAYLPENTRGKL